MNPAPVLALPLALARPSLLSFLWGLLTALVAAPIAGFASLMLFARLILAREERIPVEDGTARSGPKTRGPRPVLIFGIVLLSLTWLVGYAWPDGRAYPWYPIGVFTTCVTIALLSWRRVTQRRAWHLPSNRPGAIQWVFNQALHEAVTHGRIPPGLHGDILVLVERDGDGNLIQLTIADDPQIPSPVKALAQELLAAVPRHGSQASGDRFTLRY